jgi:hypothetical protein
VSFELTVLFAGILGVAALLAKTKLWPGGRPPILDRVSDDRFAVVLMQSDASVDPEEMSATLREHGATEVVEGDQIE